jgi:pimeloyl-ACP methyl ester carboxylesterase
VFIPYHSIVTGGDPAPACWMLVLHGIYGSGANWRTFARQLGARRPDWGLVLVDLRQHGQSQGAPGPHTVTAAARDLAALDTLLKEQGRVVRAVCGHSFGGKVALEYRAPAGSELAQTWVIDASPGARPEALSDPHNTVARVLAMLDELPGRFTDRDDFIRQVEDRGLARPLGQWLAMNLVRQDGAYVSRLDLASMRALLTDYYGLDSWPALESGAGEVHMVIAGKSSAVSPEDRARLDELGRASASVTVTYIPESGHWVHIEAPDALLDMVAAGLPRC